MIRQLQSTGLKESQNQTDQQPSQVSQLEPLSAGGNADQLGSADYLLSSSDYLLSRGVLTQKRS